MINGKKIYKSFGYAFSGLESAWRLDQNMRIHALVSILVIIASIFFKISRFEFIIMLVMIILVFTAEMLNTALEKTVDLITKNYDIDAKLAKDVSSAMVLVSAVGSVVVGFIIFIPYILDFIGLNLF